MKKIVVTVLTIVACGLIIGMVLSANKKKNEEKVAVINQGAAAVPVKAFTVTPGQLDRAFSANGNFSANQDLKLLSENNGRVVAIRVKEGDYVQKGQVLAVIDEKYLSLELETARDAWKKLRTDKERYESSFKTGGVTQAQLDDIDLQLRNAQNRVEQAGRRMADAHIKAPISGVINKKYIEVGAYLSAGTSLFDIVDVSRLKLKVSVPEQTVVQLKPGDKVSIKVPVFPEQSFSGNISFIAAKADEALNFPLEISLDNNTGQMVKAGMYGTATFGQAGQEKVIQVPRSAFVGSVHSNQVYVLEGKDQARLKQVTPGSIIGESVVILSGLTEGDRVVVAGQINLTDGARVVVQKD